MEHSNDGLTLWFDTSDAPVTSKSITVGARPAHPANAVTVQYRTDGGFISTLRASPLAAPSGQANQYFGAPLPTVPQASSLELLPVLTCSGRQTPSAAQLGATSPLWFQTPNAPAPFPVSKARHAVPVDGPQFAYELEFLGAVSASLLRPPESVGLTPQGLRKNFYIVSGSCVGGKLNARIRPGSGDWMLIQNDGVALPGVRTTWETPEGAVLYAEYSGIFDLGEDGYENALRNQFPEKVAVQLTPRFVTSHDRYMWLNRLQCLGIGHVDMVNLLVFYDLYALRGGLSRMKERAR